MESLPEDVVALLLSHVASPWVVQARLVCRKWRRILTSSHFAFLWALQLRAHDRSPSPLSLCLLSPSPPLSALHLPSLLSIPLPSPHPTPTPPYPVPLASSPLGILFSSLLLFHPFSRLSLYLPPPVSVCTPLSAAISSLTSASHFHILILGTSIDPAYPWLTAEIFSSDHNSTWRTLPCLPTRRQRIRQRVHSSCSTPSLVWWRDAFLMLWGNQILTVKPICKHTMNAGSAEEETWGRICLPSNLCIWDACYMTLHVIKDRLFLEGNFQEQGDFQRRYPLRIGVLEFDAALSQWKEVGFMPDALSERLCKRPHPVHCFYTAYSDSLSDQVCFAPSMQHSQEMEGAGFELVRFDVSSSSWSCLPLPSGSRAFLDSPTFKGFTFHHLP